MYPLDLVGKSAMVFGVANHKSIAWVIAEALRHAGARLIITYQDERLKQRVEKLTEDWDDVLLLECDVTKDRAITEAFQAVKDHTDRLSVVVHSVAFAMREELGDNKRQGKGQRQPGRLAPR